MCVHVFTCMCCGQNPENRLTFDIEVARGMLREGMSKNAVLEQCGPAAFAFPEDGPRYIFIPSAKAEDIVAAAAKTGGSPGKAVIGFTVQLDSNYNVRTWERAETNLPDLSISENFVNFRVLPFFPADAKVRKLRIVVVEPKPEGEGRWMPVVYRSAKNGKLDVGESQWWVQNRPLLEERHFSEVVPFVSGPEGLQIRLVIKDTEVQNVSRILNEKALKYLGLILDSQLISVSALRTERGMWYDLVIAGIWSAEDSRLIIGRANAALKGENMP